MKKLTHTINYGKMVINYELHLLHRKTLVIVVHPDKRVVVKAPSTSSLEFIEAIVRKRAAWINRQMDYFEQFNPLTPPRKYVGGESHLYLGRKYRLKIEHGNTNRVILKNGYFFTQTTDTSSEQVKKLMESWYHQRAQIHLTNVFEECWLAFDNGEYSKPTLALRKMSKRWGSLSSQGKLTLNTRLIQAPRECIEYVAVHELCHLVHHNHGTGFYQLLKEVMPDWERRKHRLEITLS